MKHFMQGFAQPFENWPRAHLLCLGTGLFLCAFSLCTYWLTQHLPNPALAQASLIQLEQQVEKAQKMVAKLPALKRYSQTLKTQYNTQEQVLDEVDLFHHFEKMVSKSMLQLENFEPQKASMHAHALEQNLTMRSSGSFKNMALFVRQLQHQALTAAPLTAHISPQQGALLLELTLRIGPQKTSFSLSTNQLGANAPLPASTTTVAPLTPSIDAVRSYDPFNYVDNEGASPFMSGIESDALTLKLLGIFIPHTRDKTRQAAWIQAPNASVLVRQGDHIESQRDGQGLTVLQINSRSIILSSPKGRRVLSLEGSQP